MANKAFKYKLKPTKDQEQKLIQMGGSARFIWNYMLDLNQKYYEKEKKFIFKYPMHKLLPSLKTEYPWLKDLHSQALQQKCQDLDTAMRRSFKKISGFPKFKSKRHDGDSFRIPQNIHKQIKPTKKQIKIPKLGWVNWIRHRPLDGKLKSITIKQENGFWWCICLCELSEPIAKTNAIDSEVVGIDLGLKDFCITSDGKKVKTQKLFRKQQAKLKRAQRTLSRRKKGSNNRNKARKIVNKIHFKIKNQRSDFTHKTSNQITKDYDFVAVENLNIKGMIKNKKLAKSISDQAWRIFIDQIDYKTKANGGAMIKIDRFAPSTKTCSNCDHVQVMTLSDRTYNCLNCNIEIDRDINAAINIKRWGIEKLNRAGTVQIYACGDTTNGDKAIDLSSYVSSKQEKFFLNGKKKHGVL